MMRHPFLLLATHADRISVMFLEKADDVHDDERTAALCGGEPHATAKQVHGGLTVTVTGPGRDGRDADGLVTRTPGLLLSSRSADCQTFVAYDPATHTAGVLHAGWRGLLAHAIAHFVATLHDEHGVAPENLLVGAAPSLCQACSEFTDPQGELPGIDPHFFRQRLVDLRGIADAQFADAGVTKVERDARCTRCMSDVLWSYRGPDRDAVAKGSARNVLACRLL